MSDERRETTDGREKRLAAVLRDAKPEQVLRRIVLSDLRPTVTVLMSVLWCRSDWKTGKLPKSFTQEKLMAQVGIRSRDALYGARDELVGLGLIAFTPARRGRPTQYSFPWYRPLSARDSGVRKVDT